MPVSGFGTIQAAALCLLALLAASLPAAGGERKPQRIVSLNLCTDQLLMMLVEPERIAALSFLSRDEHASVLAEKARGFRQVHGNAEEILPLKPDLVIAGLYAAQPTVHLLKRLGLRVIQVPPEESIAQIRDNLLAIAKAVGEEERGRAMVAAFDERLKRLRPHGGGWRPLAATYYAANYSSGSATLVNELIEAAGLRNLTAELRRSSTRRLALERLIEARPDLVIFSGTEETTPAVATEVLRHPALKALAANASRITIPDKLWNCGTPFSIEAIERLARKRDELAEGRRAP